MPTTVNLSDWPPMTDTAMLLALLQQNLVLGWFVWWSNWTRLNIHLGALTDCDDAITLRCDCNGWALLLKKSDNLWKCRLYPTALPYCSLSRHSRDFGQLPQAISIHDTFYLDLSHMVLALVAMRWDRFHLEAIFNSVDLLKERYRLLSFKVTS